MANSKCFALSSLSSNRPYSRMLDADCAAQLPGAMCASLEKLRQRGRSVYKHWSLRTVVLTDHGHLIVYRTKSTGRVYNVSNVRRINVKMCKDKVRLDLLDAISRHQLTLRVRGPTAIQWASRMLNWYNISISVNKPKQSITRLAQSVATVTKCIESVPTNEWSSSIGDHSDEMTIYEKKNTAHVEDDYQMKKTTTTSNLELANDCEASIPSLQRDLPVSTLLLLSKSTTASTIVDQTELNEHDDDSRRTETTQTDEVQVVRPLQRWLAMCTQLDGGGQQQWNVPNKTRDLYTLSSPLLRAAAIVNTHHISSSSITNAELMSAIVAKAKSIADRRNASALV